MNIQWVDVLLEQALTFLVKILHECALTWMKSKFKKNISCLCALKELDCAKTHKHGEVNFSVNVLQKKDVKDPRKPDLNYYIWKSFCKILCEEARHIKE
eukprot:snap_masked-scaffold_33-processed-gene-1.33-mRNA-1 protein AED:1.00 eAED:1.00 QI:0/0/0/0/1/1/2/0/98